MRYSVDAAGVTALVTDVAACVDEALSAVAGVLSAVDDAIGALRADAAGVAQALDGVFASRRVNAAAIGTRAADVISAVQDATLAYIAGDDEMERRTSASTPFRMGRGFGPVVF